MGHERMATASKEILEMPNFIQYRGAILYCRTGRKHQKSGPTLLKTKKEDPNQV
jgi:hypothetical protein